MIDNIKEIWSKLDRKARQSVVDACMQEFGLTSQVAFLQNWIWKGNIPNGNEVRVLELCQNALKLQIGRHQALLT